MARKRIHGAGTVYSYETKAGVTLYRWQLSLPIDPNDSTLGMKRYSGNGYPTARAADKAKRDAIRESEDGRNPITQTVLFKDYAATWLSAQKVANSTYLGYEKIIRVHLLPKFGPLALKTITGPSIGQFYRHLEKSGSKSRYTPGEPLTANTVNKIHVVLGAILQSAVEDFLLTVNPARHNVKVVNAPTGADIRDQQEELITWNKEEQSSFLRWNQHEAQDDFYPLWHLLSWSGMRRGEAVPLKWKDLNFENGTVSIRRSSDSGLRKAVKNSTKTRQNRMVKLDDATMTVLKDYKMARSQLGIQLIHGDSFIFGNIDGTVRNPGDVGERFARAIKKAQEALPGLPHMTIKGLRHTHATLLLESGAPAKVVQERLGHSNIQTTMNIYSHVTPTMQEDAVLQLVRHIGNE